MKKFIIGLFLFSTLLFSGCLQSVNVDDGVIRNENGSAANVEDGALVTMKEIHYENHLGNVFHLTADTSLSTGANLDFLGCTNNLTIHFTKFTVAAASARVDIYMYENPIVTLNGTAINASNMNRNSTNIVQDMDIYSTPTINATGTQLLHDVILGTAATKVTSSFDSGLEWILNPNTCYLFRITNNDGNNNDIHTNMYFYEEE